MSDWKNVQYKDGKMRTSEGGGGGGSSTFAGLDDVNFSDIQNGQVPKYNSETHKWENANESGGGGTVTDVQVDGTSVVNQGVAEIPAIPEDFADLSDVQFSNLADHQPLRYNATSQKWVNGADSFPPLIYSDEEREVGVWRDGKPLYQKVLRCNFTEDYYDFTIDASVQIKMFYGIIYASSGDYNFIHLGYGNISADKVQAYQYTSTKIRVQNSFYGTRSVGEFILLYTKTTDTPGSGTWTTQGGYAHHYDNVEKVIGTFFGKPLYERSWTLPSEVTINPSSWTSLGIPNTNIDLIVNAIGTSEWGISRVFSVSSKVDNTNLVALCTRSGNDTLKYITLQYTKTTD